MTFHYDTLEIGVPNTLEYRIFVTPQNFEETVLNMIVEIPRWTNNKLELTIDEILNPIKQDNPENKPRYVRNYIKQVKLLGILALLDGEDTDRKILAIDIKNLLSPELNGIEDVEVHMHGLLQATKECVNTTMEESPGYVTHISQDLISELLVQLQSYPESNDSSIDKWYFINET
ncbi:inorganic pyrophosphatase [Trichoderma austrokoningii]